MLYNGSQQLEINRRHYCTVTNNWYHHQGYNTEYFCHSSDIYQEVGVWFVEIGINRGAIQDFPYREPCHKAIHGNGIIG